MYIYKNVKYVQKLNYLYFFRIKKLFFSVVPANLNFQQCKKQQQIARKRQNSYKGAQTTQLKKQKIDMDKTKADDDEYNFGGFFNKLKFMKLSNKKPSKTSK